MKKFIIEDDFWEVFPEAKIGVVTCHGIDNTIKDKNQYQEMIAAAEQQALKYLTHDTFRKNKVVKIWREAFKQFKTKKGARSSIESLLKRIDKGNSLGTINPLVDLYNKISLQYALPCGGEDIDTFNGDVRLTKAKGDEPFVTLGSNKSAPPYPEEIVYKDDAGAICRCWNWREAVRTLLTEETTNAFLIIECIDEKRMDVLQEAVHDLSQQVQNHLGGTCDVSIMDINNKELIIQS